MCIPFSVLSLGVMWKSYKKNERKWIVGFWPEPEQFLAVTSFLYFCLAGHQDSRKRGEDSNEPEKAKKLKNLIFVLLCLLAEVVVMDGRAYPIDYMVDGHEVE